VFLDEVQNIDEFERLVDGLFVQKNIDLYITGSNSYMLSSELATLLTGRYFEIMVLPFSFAEYVDSFADKSRIDLLFNNYMNFGGFPQSVEIFQTNPDLANDYLLGIYKSVVEKDIIRRGRVNSEITLRKVANFAFNNIGNTTSSRKIAEALSSPKKKGDKSISHNTIDNYISALTESFVLYQLNRFDQKGKQLLKTKEKYYSVDIGLRKALLGESANVDIGRILENIVYLELLRRHGEVWLGKVGQKEIDFIVKDRSGGTEYYQVAYTAKETSTLERELLPLRNVRDHNPKYLLTMDLASQDFDGIQKINVVDWLLDK
jgi:predicted AAA+ superfamily ATPase